MMMKRLEVRLALLMLVSFVGTLMACGLVLIASQRSAGQPAEQISLTLLGGFAGILAAAGIVLFGLIRRTILRPINTFARAAQQLAEGNTPSLLLVRADSAEEFKRLSIALCQIGDYSRHYTEYLKRLAAGDFTPPLTARSDHDNLTLAGQHLATTLKAVADTASALLAGDHSAQLPFESQHNQWGGLLQQLQASFQHTQAMINRYSQFQGLSEEWLQISARLTDLVAEVSQKIAMLTVHCECIRTGEEVMANASRDMAMNTREISMNTPELENVAGNAVQRVTSANDAIDTLQTHSAEIGDIIKIITEISQQTNLLALNATIEAARAGDAGKGFAVVANEIKNLSRETARSTEDIIRKLEAIQTSSERVREVIDDVSIAVIEIHHAATLISESLNEQTTITSDVAQSLQQVLEGSASSAELLAELASLAQQTTEVARQVQTLAQRLSVWNRELQQPLTPQEMPT